ncbi:MAG: transporter substrate-binding protein [Rhodospirillales bacterium]|jgi:NitT/TauT family transport system substrate-binding protein|nr:transporter substrate-binding protein [Rhodospirillales bacterium]
MLDRPSGRFAATITMAIAAGTIAARVAGNSPAVAAESWRYGVVEAKGDAGILFMPARFGPKYDLTIDMVEFASSTTPLKGLISGYLQAFTTSPAVALTAMSHGADIKFVGCNWPGATYTLYGAPDVKTVADLDGKSVGVSGPGSMPDLFVLEVIGANGVLADHVVFANAGGGADRFRALMTGVVEATATSSEFEPEAAKRGLNILARAHDVTPNFARNCIVTSGKLLTSHRDALERFLAANMDGIAYAMAHRDETGALARQTANLPTDDPSPEFIYDEAVRQKNLAPTLAMPVDKLQWLEDMLARHQTIDKSQDVTAFIDDGPRQGALKRLQQ